MTQVDLRVRLDARGAEDGSRRAGRSFQDLARKAKGAAGGVNTVESGFERLKRGATSLAVPLTALFTAAALHQGLQTTTRELFDLQTAMAEVSTLTPDTDGIDGLTQSVRDLSEEFGRAPTEQARALYQIISAGATDSAQAVDLLDASNRLAIGGVTDVDTAARGLVGTMNAYGPAVGSATDVSDALFVAMRGGITTIGELTSSLGTITPIASEAGVSLEEVLAATSALTKGNIETSVAMRGLRQIMAGIIKPTSEAKEMAAELGLEFNAAALESQGLAGFLQNVATATGGSADQIAQLFGGVEALVPVMALAGNQADDFASILAQMETRAGATEQAFGRMAETTAFRMGQVRQEFSNYRQETLEGLLPAIEFSIDNVDTLTKVGLTLAAVYGTKVVTSLAAATKAKLAAAAAARAQIVAELEAAKAARVAAAIQFRGAEANLATAAASGRARDAMLLQAQAARALGAANVQVAGAQAAVAASSGALAAGMRGLLALVGGPLGAAVLALGAGWIVYARNAREAERQAEEHASTLKRLGQSLTAASLEEAAHAKATVDAAILRKEALIEELRGHVQLLEARRRSASPSEYREFSEAIRDVRDGIEIQSDSIERLQVVSEGATTRIHELSAAQYKAARAAKEHADSITAAAQAAGEFDLGRAIDRIEELEGQIGDLRFELDIATGVEEMEALNEKLRQALTLQEQLVQKTKAYVDEFLRLNAIDFSALPVPGFPQSAGIGRIKPTLSETPKGGYLDRAGIDFEIPGLIQELEEELSGLQIADQVARSVAALTQNIDAIPPAAQAAIRGISDVIGGLQGIKGGGVLGTITGAAGIIGGIVGLVDGIMGASAEAERQLNQARVRWQEGFDALGRMFSDTDFLTEAQADIDAALLSLLNSLGDQFETITASFTRLPSLDEAEAMLARMQEMAGHSSELIAKAGREGVEFWEMVIAAMGEAGNAAERAAEQHRKHVEALEQDLEIRRLVALGMDDEAEAMRRRLAIDKEAAAAYALGGEELRRLVIEVWALEEASLAAAEAAKAAAEAEAERARRADAGKDFAFDFERLRLENLGDDEGIFKLELERKIEQMREFAAQLLDDKVITLDQFIQYMREIEKLGENELRRYAEAIREAEEAARAAAEAERFRAMIDTENLRVQVLRLQGLGDEARELQQSIELLEAIEAGRSAEHIRLLQQKHDLEDRADMLRKESEAVQEATRSIENMIGVLNGPAGFRLNRLLYDFQGPAGGSVAGLMSGASGGSSRPVSPSSPFTPGPVADNRMAGQFQAPAASSQSQQAPARGGDLVMQLAGGAVVVQVQVEGGRLREGEAARAGEELLDGILEAGRKRMAAGGKNPFEVLTR